MKQNDFYDNLPKTKSERIVDWFIDLISALSVIFAERCFLGKP